MKRITVGVLRGGPSSEYEVSLNSGTTVLSHLDQTKYEPRDIFISRDGTWNQSGREVPISQALQGVDVVFNALHGEYGEDGTVQRILDLYNMPYTGSGMLESAIAFNKQKTKDVLWTTGINMPPGIAYDLANIGDIDAVAHDVFSNFSPPWVVKPTASGSSVGVNVAKDYYTLVDMLETARFGSNKVLVEQYINGREATCAVTDNFRNEEVYAFFPIEIIPPQGSTHWTYEAKYDGSSKEICPGNFTHEQMQEITDISRKVHTHLGLKHYSRSDFILTPNGIYFLEVNTLPGLTSESLVPKAVLAAGAKLSDFFDHLIQLALRRK